MWADLKRNTKGKIANNKREVTATGGGPSNESILSPIENAVDSLICLEKAANPTGRTFGTPKCFNVSDQSQPKESTSTSIPPPHTNSKKRQRSVEDRIQLMEEQIKNQERMSICLSEIKKDMSKLQQSVKEMVEKEDEKIAILKAIRDDSERRLQVAVSALEIKKRKLQLKELELQLTNRDTDILL